MTLLRAIVLGIVQGLTEFLPVSSSGHLILVPSLLGWERQPRSFDVALHLGTTLAVLLYFHRDFVRLGRHGIADIIVHRTRFTRWSPDGRLALLTVLGCVPAVVVGGLLDGWLDAHARSPWLVAVLLVGFGLVMRAAERWARGCGGTERLDPSRALVIGSAQALALVPGVSRSGATIAGGMFLGLSRQAAARFSFLLSAPIVVAAAVKELPELRHAAAQGVSAAELAAGCLVSFAAGLLAIHLLLRYVAGHRLNVFVWYRIAFAVLAIALLSRR